MVEPNDEVGLIRRTEEPDKAIRLLRHGTTVARDDKDGRIQRVSEDLVADLAAGWEGYEKFLGHVCVYHLG